MLGAIRAAEDHATRFDAVPDDAAIAVSAPRGQCVNGTFERIEIMGYAVRNDLDRLIVIIAANFTGLDASVKPVFRIACRIGFLNTGRAFGIMSLTHASQFDLVNRHRGIRGNLFRRQSGPSIGSRGSSYFATTSVI